MYFIKFTDGVGLSLYQILILWILIYFFFVPILYLLHKIWAYKKWKWKHISFPYYYIYMVFSCINGSEFIMRAFHSILVAWLLHQWKHTSSLNILNTRKNTLLTTRFFPLSEQAADIIFFENHIGTFRKNKCLMDIQYLCNMCL